MSLNICIVLFIRDLIIVEIVYKCLFSISKFGLIGHLRPILLTSFISCCLMTMYLSHSSNTWSGVSSDRSHSHIQSSLDDLMS